MAEPIAQNAPARLRSRAWFRDPANPPEVQAEHLLPRDDMFESEATVVAHLVFALSTARLGSRVTVIRLEHLAPEDEFFYGVPNLVYTEQCRVDYVDPDQQVAVLTNLQTSQSFTMRTDAVVRIEATFADLVLDPDKVPPLDPVTL